MSQFVVTLLDGQGEYCDVVFPSCVGIRPMPEQPCYGCLWSHVCRGVREFCWKGSRQLVSTGCARIVPAGNSTPAHSGQHGRYFRLARLIAHSQLPGYNQPNSKTATNRFRAPPFLLAIVGVEYLEAPLAARGRSA